MPEWPPISEPELLGRLAMDDEGSGSTSAASSATAGP